MKTYDAANLAAIQQGRIVQRDFLSITVRDNATDNPVIFNFWSDFGDITASVYNPATGSNENRDFIGAGSLIEISPVAHVANLIIQDVTLTLSHLQAGVEDAFRNYNARQARVQFWRGWLDPETRVQVAAAEPHFIGYVDTIDVVTGDDGAPSVLNARCVPITQQLVRYSPETRSDEYQRRRNAGDAFFLYASTVKEWELFWGTKRAKIPTALSSNIFNDVSDFLGGG